MTVRGEHAVFGSWEHRAFVPWGLDAEPPLLDVRTHVQVGNTRAALAALQSTAQRLPNPQILRQGTLRTEAQSTSALEGTYAPLAEVVRSSEDEELAAETREVLNYVRMANVGFEYALAGRSLTVGLLEELQGILMERTPLASSSGKLRDGQVVIGVSEDAAEGRPPIKNARFVPAPPGDQLKAGVEQLLAWRRLDLGDRIDPVVRAAMGHYQFETLHPFRDGNGRLGRFLVVLDLMHYGVLAEPTLTVSPWFESHRPEYYDALYNVSTRAAWDDYICMFCRGVEQAALLTHEQMLRILEVQAALKVRIHDSRLRAEVAHSLVDVATELVVFTVNDAHERLPSITTTRIRQVIQQLVAIGVLERLNPQERRARYAAPAIMQALVDGGSRA